MNAPTPQQLAAINGRGNLLVVAGAGTGKTHTLIARCLRLIAEACVSLENILLVTFTEAAAAEMRSRLREKLRELSAARPDDERLAQQLALLDTARISTLHGFCLQLAREHFHALGLDPQFGVLDESQTAPLQRAALDEILERHYTGVDADSLAVRALIRAMGRGSDGAIRKLVAKLHAYSQSLPEPERWLDEQQTRFERATPDEWRGLFLDAVVDWRGDWLQELERADRNVPAVEQCLEALRNLSARPSPVEAAKVLRCVVNADADDENWPRGTVGPVRGPLKRLFDEAEFLGALLPDNQGNDPLAQDWEWARPHVIALVSLTREFTARFTEAKRELGGLDFADLEQCALRLLQRPEIAGEWRARLAHIFVDEYQDINAAQDAILTALSRAGQEANRFLVGDVKQSIYRFRLANPGIFQRYQQRWARPDNSLSSSNGGEGRGEEVGGPQIQIPSPQPSPRLGGERENNDGRALSLTENFRSREALLNFVNPLFASLMREEIGGVRYEALDFGAREQGGQWSAKNGGPPCVEMNLIAKPDEEVAEDDDARDEAEGETGTPDLLAVEREARLVARRLRALKDNQFRIWDKEKKVFHEVQWGDMAVLLRSPRGRAEAFALEFNRAGVPLSAARDGFFASLEVSDLLNLLRLLDNPLQDVPLLAVLRSPLVGLSLDELAAVRLAAKKELFWTALVRSPKSEVQSPKPETVGKVKLFLEQFARWRELIRQTSLSQCLETALAETYYEAMLLAGERGPERVANVRKLLDLARQFDPFQRQGLYRFLRFVRSQVDEELDLQPASPPAGDAVRLLSIHKSKGLEFPIVALAGLGTRFNEQDLSGPVLLHETLGLCPKITPPDAEQSYPGLTHWLARRAEKRELRGEELRLFYVALTRARDALILVGTTNRKADAARWEAAESPEISTAEVADARSHLDWLTLWLSHATQASDWRDARTGANDLLRWKIYDGGEAEFAEPEKQSAGTAKDAPAPPDAGALDKLKARLAWEYPFTAATEEAAKTSVSAIRRRAADEADDEAKKLFPVKVPRARPAAGKMSAAEAGTAHHVFLQFVELDRVGSETELRAEAERLRHAGALTAEQAAALDLTALADFWGSGIGKKIRERAVEARRELAFTGRFQPEELGEIMGDGSGKNLAGEFVVVQGVADLAVILTQEIWLLDFKTDEVRESGLDEKVKLYAPQLKLYALALSRIYCRPVTRCWLHFLAAAKTVEVKP